MINSDKNEQVRLEAVYREAVKFLYNMKPADISDEQFEKCFQTRDVFKEKNKIVKRLCGSLQNYQSMPNVIGFYLKKERAEGFDKVLFNYDENKILDAYQDYKELRDAFAKEFNIDESNFERKNNFWTKYSKAVLSACSFMKQFKDAEDFDTFVRLFSYNEATAVALPLLLEKEIYGLGFALGCDFLKEIGYSQYPKPDVHLIGIFHSLGLCENDQLSCYKAIIRMANTVKETAFRVDKVFWLIGSGNFNTDSYEGEIKRRGNEFIEYVKGLGI